MSNSLADIIVGKSADWSLEISMFDKAAVAKSIAKKLGEFLRFLFHVVNVYFVFFLFFMRSFVVDCVINANFSKKKYIINAKNKIK